jgi:hypothetical protein
MRFARFQVVMQLLTATPVLAQLDTKAIFAELPACSVSCSFSVMQTNYLLTGRRKNAVMICSQLLGVLGRIYKTAFAGILPYNARSTSALWRSVTRWN